MRVTILGCGGSGGVPSVGNYWGACNPANPKNRRTRVSILVEQGPTALVVDTSPDFRQQMLDAGAGRIDAILYTHAHADHVHGIDDVRSLNVLMKKALPAYGSPETLAELSERFRYVFTENDPVYGQMKPSLLARPIDGPFRVGTIDVVPFEQDHGYGRTTLGLRFGRIAYSTDVVALSEPAFAVLAGIEVWIVDCLRYEPHTTHSHLAQTLSWIDRVRPKRAILTHMNYSLDYDALSARLPPGVEPGYDGLVIELPDERGTRSS